MCGSTTLSGHIFDPIGMPSILPCANASATMEFARAVLTQAKAPEASLRISREYGYFRVGLLERLRKAEEPFPRSGWLLER